MAFSFSGEYPVLSDHVSEREPIQVVINGAATTTNYSTVFIADRPYQVISVQEIHAVASTGGATTLDVTKDVGTGAPASGSSVLNGTTFNLAATANTLQTILSVNTGVSTLAVGDRLGLKLTGTPTSMTNVTLVIAIRSLY
jgi:hypothetical protein